jgi:hypothetical protein
VRIRFVQVGVDIAFFRSCRIHSGRISSLSPVA